MAHDKAKLIGNKWSPRQKKVLTALATSGKDLNAISEETGVSLSTIWRWRQNPEFTEAIICEARDFLRSFTPKVYERLGKGAANGEIDFIRLYLTHIENLEELSAKANTAKISFTWEAPTCSIDKQ